MSVLLDEETVVLEGLDFEVPCVMASAVEHAATVLIRCRGCGSTAPICDEHLEGMRTACTRKGAIRVECTQCGAGGPDLDSVSEVIPL